MAHGKLRTVKGVDVILPDSVYRNITNTKRDKDRCLLRVKIQEAEIKVQAAEIERLNDIINEFEIKNKGPNPEKRFIIEI